mgnify:CR=1 FL=1
MKYYTNSGDEVLKELNSSLNGLTNGEATNRLNKYGYNELEQKKKKTLLKMIVLQLKDAMIIILFIAALISFLLNETAEAIVILVIIFINTLISIIQEKKAENAIEALKSISAPNVKVIRDGVKDVISSQNLVVGDIVLLEAGDIVPADLRLLKTSQLQISEATLTGESVPVYKDERAVLQDNTILGERVNMAFSSTIVNYGTATGVVVATGMNTEVGKIAHMLEKTTDLDTPLKRKLNKIGKILSVVGIAVSLIIVAIGLLYDKNFVSILMIAISLAISVIPEGLPATATIVMALGVQRMAKQNALIRKLPAVETLGSTTVICSDKTGTLTQNKMTVKQFALYDDFINGKIKTDKDKVDNRELLQAAVLCNNAALEDNKAVGDPTEVALLTFSKKQNFTITSDHQRVLELPFDSDRKRMTVIYKFTDYVIYTKGAIDSILPLCNKIDVNGKEKDLTEDDIAKINELCRISSQGALRVLAFAKKNVKEIPPKKSIEKDLTFIGILSMIDPPRDEVKKAIATCHRAGIKVIMITGDHIDTAIAITKQLNIYQEGDLAFSGSDLVNMTDEQLDQIVYKTSVFARISPNDKLRIVNSLKRQQNIVAMTGDGVNDAPALKAADIGVAMGKTGTDVARESADMILLDDNFTTIEYAIKEGRRIYSNIQKVIQYLLAGNISEVLTIFLAVLFNIGTPILAVHILIVNLVTDTIPALALGVDPASDDIMDQKPIKAGTLFEKGLIARVIFHGIIISAITLIAYYIGYQDTQEAGTTMAFITLSLSQIIHSLNQHSSTISFFSKKHARNWYLYGAMALSLIILLLLVFIPPVAQFLSLQIPSKNEWLVIIALSLVPLVVVELYKLVAKKRCTNKRNAI